MRLVCGAGGGDGGRVLERTAPVGTRLWSPPETADHSGRQKSNIGVSSALVSNRGERAGTGSCGAAEDEMADSAAQAVHPANKARKGAKNQKTAKNPEWLSRRKAWERGG